MTYCILAALAASATPAPSPPALRSQMVSLGVRDMSRSVTFYGETLGLPMSGSPGEVTIFQAGLLSIALNRPLGRAAGEAIVGATEIVFQVEGVEAAHASLTGRGCSFVNNPREIFPGTWGATFTDPDGHRLTIMGPR